MTGTIIFSKLIRITNLYDKTLKHKDIHFLIKMLYNINIKILKVYGNKEYK